MKENNLTSATNQEPNSADESVQSDDLNLNIDEFKGSESTVSSNLNLLEARKNPGELLRSTREEMGIPIKVISEQTKINENQIIAIEEGDLDKLPPPTFAKAFIRSYCRVLNLDSEPVLLAFGFSAKVKTKTVVTPQKIHDPVIEGVSAKKPDAIADRSSISKSVASSNQKKVQQVASKTADASNEPTMPGSSKRLSSISFDKKSRRRKLLVLVLFVATLGVGYLYGYDFLPLSVKNINFSQVLSNLLDPQTENATEAQMPKEPPLSLNRPPVPPQIEDDSMSSPGLASTTLSGMASFDTAANSTEQSNLLVTENTAATPNSQELFPALRDEGTQLPNLTIAEQVSSGQADNSGSQSVPPNSAGNLNAPPIPAPIPPRASLSFQFTKSAWVTVRDSNDDVLLSQLNSAGSTIEVNGDPPFKLIVGNSDSVKLQYKGQAVDLSRSSRGKVARLTLN